LGFGICTGYYLISGFNVPFAAFIIGFGPCPYLNCTAFIPLYDRLAPLSWAFDALETQGCLFAFMAEKKEDSGGPEEWTSWDLLASFVASSDSCFHLCTKDSVGIYFIFDYCLYRFTGSS
jgi:hypothetical protein